jgi:hypothetical protein
MPEQSTVELPRGGGRPKKGPTRKFSRRTMEFKEREREKRRTIKARSTHRITYESNEPARRETITHRETERRRTQGMGEVRRRTTQRVRTDQQVRAAQERANEQIRVAERRQELRSEGAATGGGFGLYAGFLRILAVIVILAVLYLVLSNPGPSSGIIGGFGDMLYRFTTSTEPLFRSKAQSKP